MGMGLGTLGSRFGRLGNAPSKGVGDPVPPDGYVFRVEVENGVTYYLIDSDGYYLVEPI